jgi:pimeloyl-ACP methyl ester carboxylesterase
VSLAGVVDLVAGEAKVLSDGVVGELLAGADAAARRSADPMLLATPPVPVLLVHGTADEEVPGAYSRRYARAHPGAELLELPTIGHFELIDPRTPAFAAWRARL